MPSPAGEGAEQSEADEELAFLSQIFSRHTMLHLIRQASPATFSHWRRLGSTVLLHFSRRRRFFSLFSSNFPLDLEDEGQRICCRGGADVHAVAHGGQAQALDAGFGLACDGDVDRADGLLGCAADSFDSYLFYGGSKPPPYKIAADGSCATRRRSLVSAATLPAVEVFFLYLRAIRILAQTLYKYFDL